MQKTKHKTTIGGQAVIEGVMMRGPKQTAMAVRTPDGGINLDVWENVSAANKHPVLKWPVIRGIVSFVEMLVYGYRCLMKSAEISGMEDAEEEKKKEKKEKKRKSTDKSKEETPAAEETESNENGSDEADGENVKKEEESGIGDKLIFSLSTLLGIIIAVAIFIFLPAKAVSAIDKYLLHLGNFKTLVEGLFKIILFIIYLALVNISKDIRRVYEYHGAEHKSIFCYEQGEELTPENARRYSRLHPRCGTSFILIVIVVSIIIFSLPFIPWNNILLRTAIHILLLPLVVGLSFEVIKFAGRHDSLMRVVLAPGLWMQLLTTREPDDSQLEVAITSLKAVLTGNKEDDKW